MNCVVTIIIIIIVISTSNEQKQFRIVIIRVESVRNLISEKFDALSIHEFARIHNY